MLHVCRAQTREMSPELRKQQSKRGKQRQWAPTSVLGLGCIGAVAKGRSHAHSTGAASVAMWE